MFEMQGEIPLQRGSLNGKKCVSDC